VAIYGKFVNAKNALNFGLPLFNDTSRQLTLISAW